VRKYAFCKEDVILNEFSTYEMAVTQKIEGKWIAARAGLILFYTAYVLGLLLVAFRTRILVPLFALIPITLWIIVFFTWRYTDVDYEYSITSGELTFSKIFGNRSRRRALTLLLRDAVRIAPLDNAESSAFAENWKPEKEFSAISSLSAPDIYYVLFEYKNGRAYVKINRIDIHVIIEVVPNISTPIPRKPSKEW
jgi:hypothetical protein